MSPENNRSPTSPTDPVPLSIRALIKFFEEQLEDVAFPDVSFETLSELAHGVETQAQRVEDARQALRSSQDVLDKHLEILVSRAKKGHAYAKIFAEAQPELLEQLDAISLGAKSTKTGRSDKNQKSQSTRRSRKPKAKTEVPELPLNEATVEVLPQAM